MSFRIDKAVVGMLDVNCYFVWDSEHREALVIDPGGDVDEIVKVLEENALEVKGILLTHAHVDHIGGVPGLVERFHAPVYVHAADHELYTSPTNALLPWLPAVQGLPAPANQPPQAAGLEYQILHTPGHTPGGVCFHFARPEVLFCGDTLFCGSIGRTDLAGGDMGSLLESIREKLLTLPPDTQVHPGHMGPTTIRDEQTGNPYL